MRVLLLALALAAPARAETDLRDVKVRPGDTLWGIAQTYLKDPTRWNELLKHNPLPTSDPTIALPGMVLRVPKDLLKDDAAELIHVVRRVLKRKKDQADWVAAEQGEMLFHEYGLRTLAESWARVKFIAGSVLSLDPDSMAILKAPRPDLDHDLRLMRGGIHATVARVETPSARIIPKGRDTKYSARVLEDLSTRVQVYKGAAAVEAAGKTVEVLGGQFTEVPLNRAPSPPSKLPKMAALEAEVGEFGAPGAGSAVVQVRRVEGELAPDARAALNLKELEIGVPVAAYTVQVARTPGFDKVLFEKTYESGERIDLSQAGLPDGSYFVRASIVDLLGARGEFSRPKPYRIGRAAVPSAAQVPLGLTRPEAPSVRVRAARYRILGKTERGVQVTVNGARVGVDEDGAFSLDALLKAGANPFRIVARDLRGNETTLERTVTYEP